MNVTSTAEYVHASTMNDTSSMSLDESASLFPSATAGSASLLAFALRQPSSLHFLAHNQYVAAAQDALHILEAEYQHVLQPEFASFSHLTARTAAQIYNVTYGGVECSWRSLCEFSAIPGFVFLFFCYFLLEESPHFLLAKGKYGELEALLKRVAHYNGKEEDIKNGAHAELFGFLKAKNSYDITSAISTSTTSVDNEGAAVISAVPVKNLFSWRAVYKLLTSPAYYSITVFLFFCHFTKDFSVFGLTYVFPKFFMSLRTMAPAYELIIVSILAIPGVFLAFMFTKSQKIGHRASMQVFAGACAICESIIVVGP